MSMKWGMTAGKDRPFKIMEILLSKEHVYTVDGIERPSVTQVIQSAGLMGFMSSDQFYMQRGEMIHLATALYDQDMLDESTVDPRIRGYVEGWKKFRQDTGYKPAFIEKSLFHPLYEYAGTLDRIPLLDIKSGAFYEWHTLQISSYSELLMNAWTERELALDYHLFNTKPIAQGVYLQDDGTYKVHPYTIQDLREGLKIFLSALAIYNFKKNGRI